MRGMRNLLPILLLWPLLATARDNRENDHAQWRADIAAFQAEDRAHPPAPGAVLFIGSSSIRLWKTLAADFPGVRTINRGFGGSEIDDATHFADRIVTPYHPRAIVMYAGDNDLADGDSPQHVLEDFQAFVRKARAVDPGVPIAFIAIKPSVARQALLPQIREANDKVRGWAATQPGVGYLDVFTPMLGKDGRPVSTWFRDDGLHMNRRGYALWVGIVQPWLDAHGKAAMRH
ncbi:MAG TPA: SGNH/GDSL hydrolase family protein [Rhodanobacter sp.]|nr:SGNH/GDSL hydrolase family protein [Rhodanobacter sp.]